MSSLSDLDTTTDHRPVETGRGRIVISALKPHDRRLGKVPTAYVHSVSEAGGHPVVLSAYALGSDARPPSLEIVERLSPNDTSILSEASGLILSGGGDIDPAYFGQERHPRTSNVRRRRDQFEFNLLRVALDLDMPVLAICRGMQLLNVALGGTLEQHLTDRSGRSDHDRDRPRAEPAHNLVIKHNSLLAGIVGAEEIAVNSHHHQALDELGENLEQIAWAEDGVLEAVVSTAHSWVLGVQWHPESMAAVDARQRAIFEAFVQEAELYARERSKEDLASA
jgi:putative glutamine amidotransferase